MNFIACALKIAEANIFARSESLVTLHWVQKDINSLKTYVSNRVKKILTSSSSMYQENKILLIFVASLNLEKTISITNFGSMDHLTFKKITTLGWTKRN